MKSVRELTEAEQTLLVEKVRNYIESPDRLSDLELRDVLLRWEHDQFFEIPASTQLQINMRMMLELKRTHADKKMLAGQPLDELETMAYAFDYLDEMETRGICLRDFLSSLRDLSRKH